MSCGCTHLNEAGSSQRIPVLAESQSQQAACTRRWLERWKQNAEVDWGRSLLHVGKRLCKDFPNTWQWIFSPAHGYWVPAKVCPGTTHVTKLHKAQMEVVVQVRFSQTGKGAVFRRAVATGFSFSTQSPARGSRTLTLDTHVWITAAAPCQCCVL